MTEDHPRHIRMGTFCVLGGIADRMVCSINGAGRTGYSKRRSKTALLPVSTRRQNLFFSTIRKWLCVSLLAYCFSGILIKGGLSAVLPGSIGYGKNDSWSGRIMTRTITVLLKVQTGGMWEAPPCDPQRSGSWVVVRDTGSCAAWGIWARIT